MSWESRSEVNQPPPTLSSIAVNGVSATKGAGAFPEFRGCCFPSLELSCLCLGSRFQTKSV